MSCVEMSNLLCARLAGMRATSRPVQFDWDSAAIPPRRKTWRPTYTQEIIAVTIIGLILGFTFGEPLGRALAQYLLLR